MKLISRETQRVFVVEADDGDLDEVDARYFVEHLMETEGAKRGWFYAGFEQQNYDRVKVVFVSGEE